VKLCFKYVLDWPRWEYACTCKLYIPSLFLYCKYKKDIHKTKIPLFFSESNSFILACGTGRSLLYHIPLDTNLAENGLPLALPTNKPLAVTFHSKEQMAYWTEQSGSIVRAHLNGSSREVIATGLTRPTGIAIDYIGQILYIADQTGIKVSRLDGSYQVTLINSSEACHGIALDSEAG